MTSDLPLTAAAFLRAALDRHVPAATTDAMGEQIIDAAMRSLTWSGSR